jgi:hypothetical protein
MFLVCLGREAKRSLAVLNPVSKNTLGDSLFLCVLDKN